MNKLNVNKELKFIHSEKINLFNKKSLQFELLNIAQTMLSSYINEKTIKTRTFHKTIYFLTKDFYLKQKLTN
jgi:hypothetical protein